MSNTTTKFSIAPVVGDWVYLDGTPCKYTGKTGSLMGHEFKPVNMPYGFESILAPLHDAEPIPLTPAVMGWIGEAESISDWPANSDFLISIDISPSMIKFYNGLGIFIGDINCSAITHLHELQQLYRLLSGGKELTINPTK